MTYTGYVLYARTFLRLMQLHGLYIGAIPDIGSDPAEVFGNLREAHAQLSSHRVTPQRHHSRSYVEMYEKVASFDHCVRLLLGVLVRRLDFQSKHYSQLVELLNMYWEDCEDCDLVVASIIADGEIAAAERIAAQKGHQTPSSVA